MEPEGLLIGKGETPQHLWLPLANRHGLVAGATGTGKTVTLQVMAEGFVRAGVPVFAADVKGDLAGISQTGGGNPKFAERAAKLGVADYAPEAMPVICWDLFGRQGHPVRTTVSEMGPLLLGRLLDLNDTQEGVLTVAFKLADDEGLPLLDLKDLRAILTFVADNASALQTRYGNVSSASVGAIQRQLLKLEQEGAEHFFAEPALDLKDLLRTAPDGRGYVNLLAADQLMRSPRLYATFLLWLLSELFEELPEVGDLPKPKLVFFFDEAHLLFNDAPKALVEKVEQVVRLIRSKGVGVYFVTQNPLDVPETVLGQLGNRVQHALRAFTPRDQKAVRAAAETFRANPAFKTETAITELEVGEALVSTLQPGGSPSVVERAKICPPRARLGPLTAEERSALLAASPVRGRYDIAIDRDSAFEMLQRRTAQTAAGPDQVEEVPSPVGGTYRKATRVGSRAPQVPQQPAPEPQAGGGLSDLIFGKGPGNRQSVAEAAIKSATRSISSTVGRQVGQALVRGILGGLLRK
ncbi:MAG: helicase HerA-like domain-containing protein [Geminicoccaceae bacterium]